MSLTKLVLRNLLRHPIRSGLTALGAMVAIFLMIFLRSIVTSLDDTTKEIGSDRVITSSAVSLFQALPESYINKIRNMDGVEIVSRFTWFGGYFEDPSNFFAQFAVDVNIFKNIYPECQLKEEEWKTWADDRKGCIIGSALATKYGWQVGDKIPLIGRIYPKQDGAWDFNVCGIYQTESSIFDPQSLYFHYDYLKETMMKENNQDDFPCGLFVLKVDESDQVAEVCREIDSIYDGGPQRTLSQPEAAFQAAFVSMLGDIPTFLGWIGAAVVFALGLSLINTMLIASAERIGDMGVLKAMGFSDGTCGSLLIAESLALSLGGGLLGCGLAWVSIPFFRKLFGTQIPRYDVHETTILMAMGVGLIIGLISGIVPALRARRLDAAQALRSGI